MPTSASSCSEQTVKFDNFNSSLRQTGSVTDYVLQDPTGACAALTLHEGHRNTERNIYLNMFSSINEINTYRDTERDHEQTHAM